MAYKSLPVGSIINKKEEDALRDTDFGKGK